MVDGASGAVSILRQGIGRATTVKNDSAVGQAHAVLLWRRSEGRSLRRAQTHRALSRITGWAVPAAGRASYCTRRRRARTSRTPTRHVLILHGGELFLPSAVAQDQAIRATLRTRFATGVEFSSEGLDALRMRRSGLDVELSRMLREKYRRHPPDLVIAVTGAALEFVRRYRAQLWPQVPVVYCGVAEDDVPADLQAPDIVGVPMRFDIAGTMELALRLRPNAREAVIISGTSDTDQAWLGRAERQLKLLSGRLDVRQLSNQTVAQLRESVAALSDQSVVLFMSMFNDASGQMYTPREVLTQLAAVSSVPIFSAFEGYLGHGAVGGVVTSWEEQGRIAGGLATQVLAGRRPAELALPPISVPGCVIDVRQLRRWGIDAARVPAGCELRFRAPTFWEANRETILASGLAGLLICAAFLALWNEGRRRRRIERENTRQRGELTHATRLATIGELAASIAHEINQPLGAILSNADAAEMLLEKTPSDLTQVRQILADIRRDDLRASEVIRHMRALLRKRELTLAPVDINDSVSSVVKLLQDETHRREVQVEQQLAADLPPVAADRVHVEQVLLNLLLNAMDAMGQRRPSAARVRVQRARCEAAG